ncbi:MAG TPA: hypothetical protein VK961_10920 [Chthoniobacter sp.]|nr:hypothetical protein [Chthoniobacter sp.]
MKIDRQSGLGCVADEDGHHHDFVFGQALRLEESCLLRLDEVVRFRVENETVTKVRRYVLRH